MSAAAPSTRLFPRFAAVIATLIWLISIIAFTTLSRFASHVRLQSASLDAAVGKWEASGLLHFTQLPLSLLHADGDVTSLTRTNHTPTELSLPWSSFEKPPTWPVSLSSVSRSGEWREVSTTFDSNLSIMITLGVGHKVISVPVSPFIHASVPQSLEDCIGGTVEYFEDDARPTCHRYYVLTSVCVLLASRGGDAWSLSDAVSGWSRETMSCVCGTFSGRRAVGAGYVQLPAPRYAQSANELRNPFAAQTFPLSALVEIRAADDPTVAHARAAGLIQYDIGSQILTPPAIFVLAVTFTVLGVLTTVALVLWQARALFPLVRACCCRRSYVDLLAPLASP